MIHRVKAPLRRVVTVVGLLTIALAGCGGSTDDTASTTSAEPVETTTTATTLSEAEAAELHDEYADALAAMYSLDDIPVFTSRDAACVADVAIEAIGVDVLQEAEVDPDDLRVPDGLEGAGIKLTNDEFDDVTSDIVPCIPEDLASFFMSMLGVEMDDAQVECMAVPYRELMARSLLRTLIEGGTDVTTELIAESTAMGIDCRWAGVPETEASSVTPTDGTEAFTEALATELSTPTLEEVPAWTATEATCFAPRLVEIIGTDALERADPTARETVRYVGGEGPGVLGAPVDHSQAEELATAFLECVDLYRSMTDTFAVFQGIPQEMARELAQCVVDRVPPESWFQAAVLQFEEGAAGMQGPEGTALNAEQFEIGEQCAAMVDQRT